jgi:hypothetical protein
LSNLAKRSLRILTSSSGSQVVERAEKETQQMLRGINTCDLATLVNVVVFDDCNLKKILEFMLISHG